MTAQTLEERTGSQTLGGAVVPLLALALFINFVDRSNLATAAPLIKDEMRLTSTQVGLLLSAFFWSYTPGQLVAGWLAERVSPYRALAIGLAVWSLATALSGLAGGFLALLGLRFLLGLGEAAIFPCSSKLLAQHLPPERLGMANGIMGVGLALGPAFGTFVGGLIMARLGWREVFLIFGLASLLWIPPWWAATRQASARAGATEKASTISYWQIIRRREAWGAALGHFCGNFALYFVVSWFPTYLIKARGFSVPDMAAIGGLVYVLYAASSFATGWISDRWMRSGASAHRVRLTFILANVLLTTAGLTGAAFGSREVSIASLLVAGFAFGLGTPTIYAIGQTLAGPAAAGKWIGFQNCIANIAGIIAPAVTGMVVDRTGQFFWAYILAAAVSLAGVLGWGVLIRRIEPLSWNPGNNV